MTSGWRKITVWILLLAPATTPARTIPELERDLRRQPPQVEPFTEYRFSRLLKRPAVASGTLEYREADVWVRNVEQPAPETAVISQGEIRIRRGTGAERRLSMSRAPQLQVLLESLQALIEGRISRLASDFDVSLGSKGEAWGLRLTPRDARLAQTIARIDVFGSADAVSCIEVAEPDGDASITLLGDAHAGEAWATGAGDLRLERARVESKCRISPVGSDPG
jgi:hypothetical protein